MYMNCEWLFAALPAPRTRRTSIHTAQDGGSGSGNGMAYSIVSRVVEQYPGPSVLQVQVQYSGTVGDMLENMPDAADAPEFSSTPSSQEIYRGGREIMLDVSCASVAVPRPATAVWAGRRWAFFLFLRYTPNEVYHALDHAIVLLCYQFSAMDSPTESSVLREYRHEGGKLDPCGGSLVCVP